MVKVIEQGVRVYFSDIIMRHGIMIDEKIIEQRIR